MKETKKVTINKALLKEKIKHFFSTLKFSLYCIFHPIDGFWDLTHEKRGSMGAAIFIVVLSLLTRLWWLQYTNFQFLKVRWESVNVFTETLGLFFPFIIWVVANWATTTLFDGKGSLKNVFMASAYAVTPYPLIQIPLIFLSHIIAKDEGVFYTFFYYLSLVWCVLLIISAMAQIHEYKMSKNLICILASILGMAIIIFILLLFFSLISDGIAYFYSLYKEIAFRLY